MPLGTEVGFDPGDTVLDGDLVPSLKGAQPPPHFWPMSTVGKRLDGAWYGGKPRPGPHCVHGDSAELAPPHHR